MVIINCLICKKEKKVFPSVIKRGGGKYCSPECYFKSPEEVKNGRKISAANIGRIHSLKSRQNMGLSHRNEKHWNWKGDNVGYRQLHSWIRKYLGIATKCINGHSSKKYVWANISGEYKRELNDWHELCNRCNYFDGIKIHPRFKGGAFPSK